MSTASPQPAPPKLDYRFALRPRWLAIHVVALAALATMITAGFWQLDRLATKRAHNDLLNARGNEAVVPIEQVLGADTSAPEAEPALYRNVSATGTYRPGEEVFVRGRSLNGAPGAWVLTPLVLADGSAVAVNRGWVPASTTTPTLPEGAEAPDGTVTVSGLLMPGHERGRLGSTDPATGTLAVLARADLDRLQVQVSEDLYPVYLQLAEDEAGPIPVPTSVMPTPLPPPERTEGPHLGYALQWFAFAAIWVVGYPLLVRRSATDRAREGADDDDPLGRDGDPAAVVDSLAGATEVNR